MKKKNISLFLIITMFFLCITTFNIKTETRKNNYSSLLKNQNIIENVINSKKESPKVLLTDLYFNNQKLIYDSKNNKFFYSLIEGIDTSYNPIVEWNKDDINIVFDNSINNEIIASNSAITVCFYNDSYYYLSYIVCTTLPIINIQTNEKALNSADELIGSRAYMNEPKMRIQITNNELALDTNYSEYEGSIKVHGGTSKMYDKLSYTITVKSTEIEKNKQSIKLLNLKTSNKYILYAAFNDQEKIRNVFSTNLWKDSCGKHNLFGIDNGPYYKYCELFINNEYWGLYALGYSLDDNQEKINPNSFNENIYKKSRGDTNEYDFDFKNIENNGYENITNYNSSWLPLANYYKLLNNSRDIDVLYKISDIDNSIDLYLFYNLIQGCDNVNGSRLHNTFLISKDYNDDVIMMYCPWDLDRTWGNGFVDEEQYDLDLHSNFIMEHNPVYKLLELNDDRIKSLVLDRYKYLRNNDWSDDNIINALDKYEKSIFNSGAYNRDKIRWPNGQYINESLKLSLFKDYVQRRLDYFDVYIEEEFELH